MPAYRASDVDRVLYAVLAMLAVAAGVLGILILQDEDRPASTPEQVIPPKPAETRSNRNPPHASHQPHGESWLNLKFRLDAGPVAVQPASAWDQPLEQPAKVFGTSFLSLMGPAAGEIADQMPARMLSPESKHAGAVVLGDDRHRMGFELRFDPRNVPVEGPDQDLLILESGTRENGPEAWMIRVRTARTDRLSDWRYRPADGFRSYAPPRPGKRDAGVFLTVVELADFGLTTGQSIIGLQIANLQPEDRVLTEVDSPRSFQVVASHVEAHPHAEPPDPGPLAPFPRYPSANFDPDIVWLGVLVQTAP